MEFLVESNQKGYLFTLYPVALYVLIKIGKANGSSFFKKIHL